MSAPAHNGKLIHQSHDSIDSFCVTRAEEGENNADYRKRKIY